MIGAAMTGVGFFGSSVTLDHVLISIGAVFMTIAIIGWVYATKYTHDHERDAGRNGDQP